MASYKGHLKGGIIAGIGIVFLAKPFDYASIHLIDLVQFSSSVLIGSLLPDIDHPQSIIGQRVPFISTPIHKLWGHRSITHSIFFLMGSTYLAHFLSFSFIALGLGIGILSHILLDLLCPGSGVAFLYPLYKHRIQLVKKSTLFKKRKRRKKRR